MSCFFYFFFFFFNDTATTEIYTLSLHDALPILVDEDVEVDVELVEVVGGVVVLVLVVVVDVTVVDVGAVVEVVGGCVAVVVVVVGGEVVVETTPVTATLQPVPVAGGVGLEAVAKGVLTVRAVAVVVVAVSAG